MRKYYVGLDVHKLTIAIAVLNAHGKLVTQAVIETSTEGVRDFFRQLRGGVHLTFEEGNHAAWLYDVVEPLVRRVVVCNPKHNREGVERRRHRGFRESISSCSVSGQGFLGGWHC